MTWKLSLKEAKSPHFLETKPRYKVLLNGKPNGDEFYFNMTGYRGRLPNPYDSTCDFLDFGELGITKLRKEIAILNRVAKKAGLSA